MDKLNMGYINSLPQPLIANFAGSEEWEVYDIDVQTGLMRILVCGLLEVRHIGEVLSFTDLGGELHNVDSFYKDQP